MPLVSGGNPRIELDAYVDKSDFDAKVAALQGRLDGMKEALVEQSNAIDAAAKQSTMSWTDFRSMYQTVLDVVRVGQQVWQYTGQLFVDNSLAAGNMARNLGTTTEEASRLREMADDVGISVDKLTQTFRIAEKHGYAPTIEGLASMSDAYLKLAPGIERDQYLQEIFGKGGEEMGKLLDKGRDSIMKLSAEQDKNLVVTEDAYKEAQLYKIALDNLSDAARGAGINIGGFFTKAVTNAANSISDRITAEQMTKDYGQTWQNISDQQKENYINLAAAQREQTEAMKLSGDTISSVSGVVDSATESYTAWAGSMVVSAEAAKKNSDENQGMLSLIDRLQGVMGGYNEKLAETTKKYGENSDAVKKLQSDHDAAMKKIAVDLFVAKLSAGGLTDEEFNTALQAELSAGMIDQATVDMAKSFDGATTAAANSKGAVVDLHQAAIDSQGTYVMNIVTRYIQLGVNTGTGGGTPLPPNVYADGTDGWQTVPPGYPNDTFVAGLSSGEKFNVIPKNEASKNTSPSGGGSKDNGSGLTINIYGGQITMPEMLNGNNVMEMFG